MSVRATTGVDPVTGRELSEAERIAAGAMAAAGFIPIVGWAGRAVKGGSAIYKTAKTVNAAEHAMGAYKTADSMKWMAQAEKRNLWSNQCERSKCLFNWKRPLRQ